MEPRYLPPASARMQAMMNEFVIEIQAGLLVPQEAIDAFRAVTGALVPDCRVRGTIENSQDFGRLPFHQVEERVQANRVVVDDIDIELAEPVGRVESRFSHRAIALVEQRGEDIAPGIVVFTQDRKSTR